jgi:ribonucleotide reductase alpha subunit
MITSADEFIRLRTSDNPEEYRRAIHESADIDVWMEVIRSFPDYKEWVIHNKTIQIEILEELSKDSDPRIREDVARKRKINDEIFYRLARDEDEHVRYALACNTKMTVDQIEKINHSDSEWLKGQLEEIKRNRA